MKIWSQSFNSDARIPATYAFGKPDPKTHVTLSDNRNPHLAWGEVPEGTKSFVLLCVDVDVPSVGDNVNQEGKLVSESLPRVDFYHWVLVDLKPSEFATSEIKEGEFSDKVVAKGKSGPKAPKSTRQGTNDYTGWFKEDPEMAGQYYGYDGPCPPWNDEKIHRYRFTLYATDLEKCPVDGDFTGAQVLKAIEGHILAEASLTGTYSIYQT